MWTVTESKDALFIYSTFEECGDARRLSVVNLDVIQSQH